MGIITQNLHVIKWTASYRFVKITISDRSVRTIVTVNVGHMTVKTFQDLFQDLLTKTTNVIFCTLCLHENRVYNGVILNIIN